MSCGVARRFAKGCHPRQASSCTALPRLSKLSAKGSLLTNTDAAAVDAVALSRRLTPDASSSLAARTAFVQSCHSRRVRDSGCAARIRAKCPVARSTLASGFSKHRRLAQASAPFAAVEGLRGGSASERHYDWPCVLSECAVWPSTSAPPA